MGTASKPAVEQAVSVVTEHIVKGTWNNGSLPGIRSLATLAGVSQASMWKALQVLKERKVVKGYAGKRFAIVSAQTAAGPDAGQLVAKVPRWEMLKRDIERDILNGVFGPGDVLPTIKELGYRYGASYHSLRRALEALRTEAVVRRYKRVYRSERPVPSRSHARIALFCLGNFAELLRIGRPRNQEFLREVERECLRRNISLDILAHSLVDGGDRYFDKNGGELQSLPHDFDALGFLCHSPGCEVPQEVLAHAARLRKPVAVMDEAGMPAPQILSTRRFPYASFQTGYDSEPAEKVARYLLQLGHTAIAYVSPFHATTWSKNRYAGLCKVYAAAGYPDAVAQFTIDQFAYPQDYERQMIDSHELAPFLRECDRVEAGFPRKPIPSLDRLRDRVLAHLVPDEIGLRLAPQFDEALRNKTLTAWVGANDTVALAALHFLKGSSKSPATEAISVLGFDNTLDSFNYNLTSYDFNIPVVVRSMIDFVVNPTTISSSTRGGIRRVEGILVERGTTRARTAGRIG